MVAILRDCKQNKSHDVGREVVRIDATKVHRQLELLGKFGAAEGYLMSCKAY